MYQYHPPTPIVIRLNDELGWNLRQKAANYLISHQNKTGAERGSLEEQGFGTLAEMVVRNHLSMPEIQAEHHPLSYDILLPSGVKMDVKCRGGALPFQEAYVGSDGIPREAKHNFFARQIVDEQLDTDIYLMTHLETPSTGTLPGTMRQRKWALYICGWVSKERVAYEGVYLPRGSLTEQGRTWFTYRGQEIEFYNKNLNGLSSVKELLKIDKADVESDKKKLGRLNVTNVDAIRMAYDLVGRGLLKQERLDFLISELKVTKTVRPILNPNQYHHLLNWLKGKGKVTDAEIELLAKVMPAEPYAGI